MHVYSFASFYFFLQMNDLFNITTEEEFQQHVWKHFNINIKRRSLQKFVDF